MFILLGLKKLHIMSLCDKTALIVLWKCFVWRHSWKHIHVHEYWIS